MICSRVFRRLASVDVWKAKSSWNYGRLQLSGQRQHQSWCCVTAVSGVRPALLGFCHGRLLVDWRCLGFVTVWLSLLGVYAE